MAGELGRLEAWSRGHKARAVAVRHDGGYVATCWVVDLSFEPTAGVNRSSTSEASLMGDGDDWPGLAATVAAALDGWDALAAKGASDA